MREKKKSIINHEECRKTDQVKAMRIIGLLFLVFFFVTTPLAIAQNGDSTTNILVEMGFENVRWSENQNERVYVIENTAYRLNGIGIGKAIDLIQEVGMPENKSCRLVVTDNNVPQLSLFYQYNGVDSTNIAPDSLFFEYPKQVNRADWSTSYDLGDSWKHVRKAKKKNSSLYKVDIVVYPELSFKNMVLTQIYQVLFNLSPALEVSLWEGMKFSGQVIFPIYNDGYGSLLGKTRPGFISASQKIRLPGNIFTTTSVGIFNGDRYGVDFKAFYPFFLDERLSLEGRVSYTGTGYWDGFSYYYSKKKTLTWSIGGNLYWSRYNTQLNMRLEQYLLGEKGVICEMTRHFRYTSIAFYAGKAQIAKPTYGFRFQVALPPYKYKRHKYYPRITPSKNMGIKYNGSNERYYYSTFRTQPGDNIMQQNSFNPYFIKSELLNF